MTNRWTHFWKFPSIVHSSRIPLTLGSRCSGVSQDFLNTGAPQSSTFSPLFILYPSIPLGVLFSH